MVPDEKYIFEIGLEDVSAMNKILHELHHSDDHCVLVVNEDGISLITNGEKTFQISAFFAASTFQTFEFDSERFDHINFRFIMRDFIECLNLLRDDPMEEKDRLLNVDDPSRSGELMKTSLLIVYRKEGDRIKLRLENNSNYTINCELKAFNLAGDAIFSPMVFNAGEDTAVIVFDSKKLYEYVSGMDFVTCDFVSLLLEQGHVPLRIRTKSTQLGEVELEIKIEETEIIRRELRLSSGSQFSFSYRTQFIKPALDALKCSSFMKLKCGSSGLLCIEHFHGVATEWPEFFKDNNQPRRKRSSVEYFILSEVRPADTIDSYIN